MTLKNKNPWKLLSVGLLGVIAIGLITPIDAVPGNAQGTSSILDLLLDSTFGLEAISNDVADANAKLDALADDIRCNDFVGNLDFHDCDLSNTNLSELDLTGADLSGADLSGADLTGAILIDADVTGIDFTDATLTDVLFCSDEWPYVMCNTDLTGATLGSFYIDLLSLPAQSTAANYCDISGSTAIAILDLEFTSMAAYPTKLPTGFSSSGLTSTVFTILCEDITP